MDKEARIKELLTKPRMFNHPAVFQQCGGPIYEMIKKYWKPDFRMAEIGSYSGGSTELFALSCAHVYSIDPYEGTTNPSQEGQTVDEAMENIRRAEQIFIDRMKPYSNVTKIKKRSLDAVKDFPDGSLDGVYIDGDHRDHAVAADCLAWAPKAKVIVAGHDYYENIALGVSNSLGVPHEVFEDSSFVFVKGQKNPQRFLVKTIDDSQDPFKKFGLFAIVFQVMGLLASKADSEHLVVDLTGKTAYLDPSRNELNPWDYFFAQPSYYRPEYVLKDIERGQITNYRNDTFTESNGLFSFHDGTMDWPADLVAKARDICAKYIKIHPEILAIANKFYWERMAGKKVCGLQVRGTDLWYQGHANGQRLDMKSVMDALDRQLETHEFFYLATDEYRILEMFRGRYGARLIHYDDATLSKDGTAIHKDTTIPGYKKGVDVIVEAILLSRCNYLLAMSSNVSRFASIYSSTLKYEFIDKSVTYRG